MKAPLLLGLGVTISAAGLASQPAVARRSAAPPAVEVVAVPDGGIQPQALMDPGGTMHLLYFKGDTMHGDLFYVHRAANASSFSRPVQVNSIPGSAIARGSVRGGRLALGRDGWIHAAWNGSTPVERNGVSENPMWYTRITPAGRVEPQRAIGAHVRNLDGGGDVAADAAGNVYVVWHAAGSEDGEANRRIYVAASADDGGHFGAEQAYGPYAGNCGCCQVETLIDSRGRMQVLYRAAGGGVHRDATWLTFTDGKASAPVTLQPWELPACPMTTFALVETPGGLVAAWETAQQIYTATLDPMKRVASPPSPMEGTGARKHPRIAVNAVGDRLFAWTDGTSSMRGGTLAWELRSPAGQRLAAAANAGEVPATSLVAAVPRRDGSFLIIH